MPFEGNFDIGEIAQLVERRTHKPKVKGSIPFLATIQFQAGVKPRLPFEILYEDRDLVVIDKPDGLLTTHTRVIGRAARESQATAENILSVMLYKPGNEVLPHILRLGDTEIGEACAKAITMMDLDFCPDMAII